MTITIEEAISLIRNSSKYRHSLLVSKIMATLAKYFDKPERDWMLVGLLHDLDYDHVEDFSQHGLLASKMLADKLPQEAIHAIQAHDFRSGVKPSNLIDEALIFADSFAVFLESNAKFDENHHVFKAKPWLWSNLTEFQDKYDFNVSELIEQYQNSRAQPWHEDVP